MSSLIEPWYRLYDLLLPWLPWITLASVVMALASLLLIPAWLSRLPADYFLPRSPPPTDISARGRLLWLARNLLAMLLLLLGLLMLFLPGQGILTLLIAISLSSMPGKFRLERALIRRRSLFRTANWIRIKYHRPPFLHPDGPRPESERPT